MLLLLEMEQSSGMVIRNYTRAWENLPASQRLIRSGDASDRTAANCAPLTEICST